MTKAIFSEKQDPVRFTEIDGKTTVQICINEDIEEATEEEGDTAAQYAYDFNEWTEKSENVDKDAITANPENYIDYVPGPEPTATEQRITDIEDTIADVLGGES